MHATCSQHALRVEEQCLGESWRAQEPSRESLACQKRRPDGCTARSHCLIRTMCIDSAWSGKSKALCLNTLPRWRRECPGRSRLVPLLSSSDGTAAQDGHALQTETRLLFGMPNWQDLVRPAGPGGLDLSPPLHPHGYFSAYHICFGLLPKRPRVSG